MVDMTFDIEGSPGAPVLVKLQTETWEVNVWAPLADLARLRNVKDADWDARRSLAIGTCAGASVYWAMEGEDQVSILIGHDDETWDVGVTIPLATAYEIALQAEQQRRSSVQPQQ
jgi:hypothetical protein